ncbi:hypothetical protein, partial [Actinomadura sp. BRA 177]|uniref:hypothetical protein n=1 Tax=Actinomadura sp. BRA 177 TaxID=2745202 RepID=UPI0017A07D16
NGGERPDGQIVIVAGLLSGLQRQVTQQATSWAMFQLEDLGGPIEVPCFPSSYQPRSTLLAEHALLIVTRKPDRPQDVATTTPLDGHHPPPTRAPRRSGPNGERRSRSCPAHRRRHSLPRPPTPLPATRPDTHADSNGHDGSPSTHGDGSHRPSPHSEEEDAAFETGAVAVRARNSCNSRCRN